MMGENNNITLICQDIFSRILSLNEHQTSYLDLPNKLEVN